MALLRDVVASLLFGFIMSVGLSPELSLLPKFCGNVLCFLLTAVFRVLPISVFHNYLLMYWLGLLFFGITLATEATAHSPSMRL